MVNGLPFSALAIGVWVSCGGSLSELSAPASAGAGSAGAAGGAVAACGGGFALRFDFAVVLFFVVVGFFFAGGFFAGAAVFGESGGSPASVCAIAPAANDTHTAAMAKS